MCTSGFICALCETAQREGVLGIEIEVSSAPTFRFRVDHSGRDLIPAGATMADARTPVLERKRMALGVLKSLCGTI